MTYFNFNGLDVGWAVFAARVILGVIILIHAWPKIKSLKATGANFQAMGFEPGMFWGTVVALVEFFGGLAMLSGAYAQFFAFLFVVEFTVIVIWKYSKGMEWGSGDYELDFALMGLSLVVVALGSGVLPLF